MFTMDGPVEVAVGTDGALVRGLPVPPPEVAHLFPYSSLENRQGQLLLVDGSPTAVAAFVAELGRRGINAVVRHTFARVALGRTAPPQPRRAQHTF
ncbi:hypothetical protein [Micromonospora sp. DH14]|uniref:hypothetical protein n=1 Tax=Micromonospora sp. DH14 TaxID=3040120 RepID=UPI002442D876|nr:hypothetical protein [Micromonospora sp. DH14]MDG9673030.1 hypothetical protein [Micromonospora sp. DH14]